MRSRFPLVAALFLISGATGLLYEVAFSKLLAYVFGATAYAVSTVLAAFMGGLALGAHFGGRRASRLRHPLVAYGSLEILVGAVCALSPFAFEALTSVYVQVARAAPGSLAVLTVVRAGLTGLVVVIPTMGMGATLPVLSRIVAAAAGGSSSTGEDPGAARRLATLYAINTAGGALGALSGAYLVLPALGIRGTIWVAAVANLLVGAVAIAAGRHVEVPATTSELPARETADESSGASTSAAMEAAAPAETAAVPSAPSTSSFGLTPRLLVGLAFSSGFLVFAAEVIQTHLLALLIGNSAYAFGLMLAVFLVCLALGAARAPGFARRHGAGALWRGLAVTALALALTLPLWDQLPHLFTFAGRHVHSWTGRELVRALAAFAILALPTLYMGTTFPLLLQQVAGRADVAARVGVLTSVNTLGTIAGSIGTGYVILPVLGSQRALGAVAAGFGLAAALAAMALGRDARAQRERALAFVTTGAAALLALLMPRWDLARLTSGANVYFVMGPPPDGIDFVREDVHGGVTTVVHRAGITTMYTNGKFQGDDGPEMVAQRRFAHFPSLFVPETRRALVIGLGTGTTLGTLAAYPWQRLDVAEISPAIVEAARAYFAGPSRSALDDPRVHLSLNDGRNELLVATEPYDLVTMEVTSIWFAGAATLYSREFYELVRARLSERGILQQWVQLHHIRPRELATVIRTLRSVFPHVALFAGGGQGILVASARPLVASEAHLEELEKRPALRETLEGRRLDELLGELLSSGEDLDRFVADVAANDGGPIVSTDDNLYLEYATPKGNVLDYPTSLRATLDLLERYRTPDPRARHLGP
ncbi:fused MFS/spermidine synthase [Chondromyces crocatus]|uniref:Spermidine synthase n=1 Tax=Chondromyces crocatus TaxID=52 RepID=A0A0K1EQM9_CHOCO|nr:fused MFS/spermidine synthase [Chondromyces crocatus]AKT43114.1 spermidine synthase [Chondromyces crocatus]